MLNIILIHGLSSGDIYSSRTDDDKSLVFLLLPILFPEDKTVGVNLICGLPSASSNISGCSWLVVVCATSCLICFWKTEALVPLQQGNWIHQRVQGDKHRQ